MNEQAANALLKTLEEPPSYVVLLLLTDKPSQVLPTIASRCQPVRFDAPSTDALAQRLQSQGVPPEAAQAAARLSLGDGEKALALALGDGPTLRAAAESARPRAAARPVETRSPGGRCSTAPERAAQRPRRRSRPRSRKSSSTSRRRSTSGARRSSPSARDGPTGGPRTQALDHALQLTGLWYRDLACVAAGAPELAFHSDRAQELQQDAGRDQPTLQRALELVDDTRAALILNVSEELACEALAYRLEETLSSRSSAPPGTRAARPGRSCASSP